MPHKVISKERLEASICVDSFAHFVRRFWSTIIAEKAVWNWHIDYLCDELQIMAERVFNREDKLYDLIINISPGSTKSTIVSVMFPVWCWVRDATIRSICASYAFPLSLHLAMQSRNILMSDKFQTLFPQIALEQASKGWMITTDGGQRVSTSTGGSVTGMHGHFLIVDDPINPQEAASAAQLQTTNDWVDQTLMTRKIDKRVTPLIVIMQRLNQNDTTGHLLSKAGAKIRHICLPAEINEENMNSVRPRRLRSRYIRGLMDPVRLSPEVLRDARRDLGEYAYAGQMLQSPIPAGGGLFRGDRMEVVPSPSHLKRVVRYWDKAGTRGGGAYTVGLKMGITSDGFYEILDVRRGQWEASERERIIKQTAGMDGRAVQIGVEQEPGSGGKESVQSTVRNLAGFHVRVDRPVGAKELRADPLAVQVNEGNVRMVKGDWNKEYLEELKYFPHSKYKDQVDASSGAFNMLVPRKTVGVPAWARRRPGVTTRRRRS
jgi:predicted phage terminase large subunit-like protein